MTFLNVFEWSEAPRDFKTTLPQERADGLNFLKANFKTILSKFLLEVIVWNQATLKTVYSGFEKYGPKSSLISTTLSY